MIEHRPYESNATHMTGIVGWVCTHCQRYHGNSPNSEHFAKYCCATTLPCSEEGCTGRAEKHYTHCEACREKRDYARYLAKPRVEWDGVTPVVTNSDEFFFDADSLACYLGDLDPEELPHVRLEICETQSRTFDMNEFLEDVLPSEDYGADPYLDDTEEINKTVNDWITAHEPISWLGSGKIPTNESIEKHTGIKIPS